MVVSTRETVAETAAAGVRWPVGARDRSARPGARYVKAFNTVFSTFMHGTPPATPAALVHCGDDPAAKAAVAELIADLGFDPVDAGGADATPLVEAFAKLVIGLAYRRGAALSSTASSRTDPRHSALDSAS